jgi:hypothetical protein
LEWQPWIWHKVVRMSSLFLPNLMYCRFFLLPFLLIIICSVPGSSIYQPRQRTAVIRNEHNQNADFPHTFSKREKKPFPIPALELRRRAKPGMKAAQGRPKRPMPPPKNGMLVHRLIPVLYRAYSARILLINNLKRLMIVAPVKGCK